MPSPAPLPRLGPGCQILNVLSCALAADLPSIASDDVAITRVANLGKAPLSEVRRVFQTSNTKFLGSAYEAEVAKFRAKQKDHREVRDWGVEGEGLGC